jgi:hypothetical protein
LEDRFSIHRKDPPAALDRLVEGLTISLDFLEVLNQGHALLLSLCIDG